MGARLRLLVIGLGSMGKRRVRNLQALGISEIGGFDPREDRRAEAHQRYGISVSQNFEDAIAAFQPDALIISTPPDQHMHYAWAGFERGLHCFIEASVVHADRIRALHDASRDASVILAPSCTMRFMSGPKRIKEILANRGIGQPLFLHYQTGQYLPDWHPWESIEEFYVSQREMGGCREIVPFELTWLNDLFGTPEPIACEKTKLTEMNAEIDDIYSCVLRYPDGMLASLSVEVISRPHATRELRLLGSEGQLVFSADENCVRYATAQNPEWIRFELGTGSVEPGYINAEEPYIAEMKAFLDAVLSGGRQRYPNTLLEDWKILQVLERLERLSGDTR